MSQQMNDGNRELLEAKGFEISEMTGFESHNLPLFAHRHIGDKHAGDVVLNARIGDPSSLDDAEATYLARKAFHGLFPWQPGKECLERRFVEIAFVRESASSVQQKSGEASFGCRWCRKEFTEPGSPQVAPDEQRLEEPCLSK